MAASWRGSVDRSAGRRDRACRSREPVAGCSSAHHRGMRVAAASQLGFRNAPGDGEVLSLAPAGGIVNAVHHTEVLGENGMAGIAERQGADHLDHAGGTDGRLAHGNRIAYDDVGEVRSVEIAILAFQVDAANLLHHPVEIVDRFQTGLFLETTLELSIVNRDFLQFLPSAAMDQDAVSQRDAAAGNTLEEVLPHHESEAEDEEGP